MNPPLGRKGSLQHACKLSPAMWHRPLGQIERRPARYPERRAVEPFVLSVLQRPHSPFPMRAVFNRAAARNVLLPARQLAVDQLTMFPAREGSFTGQGSYLPARATDPPASTSHR